MAKCNQLTPLPFEGLTVWFVSERLPKIHITCDQQRNVIKKAKESR